MRHKLFTFMMIAASTALCHADLLWTTHFGATSSDINSYVFTPEDGVITAHETLLSRVWVRKVNRSGDAIGEVPTNTVFTPVNSLGGFGFAPSTNGATEIWTEWAINDVGSLIRSGGTITSITLYLYGVDNTGNAAQVFGQLTPYYYNSNNVQVNLAESFPTLIPATSNPSSPQSLSRIDIAITGDLDIDNTLVFGLNATPMMGNIGIARMEINGTAPIPEPTVTALGLMAFSALLIRRRKE